jgi:hypothetical protein
VHKAAINYEAVFLKANGIWGKLKAFHPHIGGTATAHSGNLMSIGTSGGNSYITWYNSPTFNSSGTTGNGTSQYGDTHFYPDYLPANNIGIGYYSGTDLGTGNGHGIMGCQNSGGAQLCWLLCTGTYSGGIGDNDTTLNGYAQSHTNGLWSINRISSTNVTLYYGNTPVESNSVTNSGSVSTRTIYLLGTNGDGNPTNLSTLTCQGDYIGTNLTATDIANLNAMFSYVNQTILGR